MTTLSRKIRKYERPFYYVITAVIALSFFVWTADFSTTPEDEIVGAIDGKPVSRLELETVGLQVETLAVLDGFSRSPSMSASFARGRWLGMLAQARQSLRDPRMRGFYMAYLGLGDIGDLSQHSVREALAWKWLAWSRAAEKAGIRVATGELAQFIREISGTPPNAPFQTEAYAQFVQSERGLGMPVAYFEKVLERYLQVSKYFDAVGGAADVTGEELLNAYLEENREVELGWLAFAPADFAAAAGAPDREAVARRFRDKKGDFSLPAKARVEFLLADAARFAGAVETPSEADIKTRYEARKEIDHRNPDGGKDGKPAIKPLDEVRAAITEDLRKERSLLKAAEVLQKALLEIGALEVKQRQDPAAVVDFTALAKQFDVTRGETPYFEELHVEDAEAAFGKFREPRDRDAFKNKVFKHMADGEVMRDEIRPLATDKGYLIYRLAHRKPARVPDQLSGEVEEEIVRQLRREAQDKLAVEQAKRWQDAINADGVAKAETTLGKPLVKPPALKPEGSLPDPAGGEHATLSDGHRLVEQAFSLRKTNEVGKARIVDAGTGQTKYVVALLKALEAKMEDFEKQKPWLREKLLDNGFERGMPVPGKRQKMIDARRAELEKTIQKKQAPDAAGTPAKAPAPPLPPRPGSAAPPAPAPKPAPDASKTQPPAPAPAK
jgi:hypothetical protein